MVKMTVMVALPNRDVKIECIAKVKPHIVNFQPLPQWVIIHWIIFNIFNNVYYIVKGPKKPKSPIELQKNRCQFCCCCKLELSSEIMWVRGYLAETDSKFPEHKLVALRFENNTLRIVFRCEGRREHSWWLSYVHTATAHLMEWGLTGISFINCN